MGTRSGRKARFAVVLVDALDPSRVPEPLDRLLADGVTTPGPRPV